MKKLWKTKRNVIIICAIIAALAVGGTSVYAYSNYQEQKKADEQAKKEAEQKVLEEKERQEEINASLESLNGKVVALYKDDALEYPKEDLTWAELEPVLAEVDEFTYKGELSDEQEATYEEISDNLSYIKNMYTVVGNYKKLFDGEQPKVESTETTEAVNAAKEALANLKDVKTVFYEDYTAKLTDAENTMNHMKSVEESVYLVYSKEAAQAVDGVTRDMYNDVLDAVNGLTNETLKVELLGYLAVVDEYITEQEATAASTNSGNNGNSTVDNSGTTEDAVNGNSSNSNSGSGSSDSGSSSSSGSSSGNSSSDGSSDSESGVSSGGTSNSEDSSSSDSGSSKAWNDTSGSESWEVEAGYQGEYSDGGVAYGGQAW